MSIVGSQGSVEGGVWAVSRAGSRQCPGVLAPVL